MKAKDARENERGIGRSSRMSPCRLFALAGRDIALSLVGFNKCVSRVKDELTSPWADPLAIKHEPIECEQAS